MKDISSAKAASDAQHSRSLLDFASERQANRLGYCLICSLPGDLCQQINDAKAQGVSYRTMSAWLTEEHGIANGTRNRLTRHFGERHHEADAS